MATAMLRWPIAQPVLPAFPKNPYPGVECGITTSATRMLLTLWVPVVTMAGYRASTKSEASGMEPTVIFLMVVSQYALSPGLMRSGL